MSETAAKAPAAGAGTRDRWGFSWQITPKRPMDLTTDPDCDKANRAMAAMMTMKKIDIAALEAAASGSTA